ARRWSATSTGKSPPSLRGTAADAVAIVQCQRDGEAGAGSTKLIARAVHLRNHSCLLNDRFEPSLLRVTLLPRAIPLAVAGRLPLRCANDRPITNQRLQRHRTFDRRLRPCLVRRARPSLHHRRPGTERSSG